MTLATYALIDDINNSSNENHAPAVEATFAAYASMFGATANIDASFQMPTDATTFGASMLNAAQHTNALVINNSWDAPYALDHAYGLPTENNAAYQASLQIFQSGKTMVFAAGNYGAPFLVVNEPAASPFNIVVSAGDTGAPGNQWELTSYTSEHPGITNYVTYGGSLDGSGMVGTSFAAPRVSALVSCLQTKFNNTLTQSDIRTALNMGANHLNLPIANPNTPYGNPGNFVYNVLDDASMQAIVNGGYVPGQNTIGMQVDALYKLLLDRNPDQGGLNAWTTYAQQHGLASVVNAFMQSGEYQQDIATPHTFEQTPLLDKVQAMYHLFFNRESDDGGLAAWTNWVIQSYPANSTQYGSTGQFYSDWNHIAATFTSGVTGSDAIALTGSVYNQIAGHMT
jgi:hypothetical protein